MEEDVVKYGIISKEDFKKYFSSRKAISKKEYIEYLIKKAMFDKKI